MQIKSHQLFTAARPQTKIGKIVQFPLTRIPIVIAFLIPVTALHNLFVEFFLKRFEEPTYSYILNIETIINFALFLLLYRLYTRVVERRKPYEISGSSCLKELDYGFVIGGGLILIMVALLSVLGYYQVESTDTWSVVLNAIFLFGMGAFVQELFFRIIVFRLVEEWLGTWLALLAAALIFSAFHIGNPNVTIWTTIALILQDVLLSAAFIYTRRIWFVWGIHAGWNFLQDGIFGMPNSGVTSLDSWITPAISGPEWLTGGSFGIEASYISTILCVALGVTILVNAIKKGQLVIPRWKRIAQIPSTEGI